MHEWQRDILIGVLLGTGSLAVLIAAAAGFGFLLARITGGIQEAAR